VKLEKVGEEIPRNVTFTFFFFYSSTITFFYHTRPYSLYCNTIYIYILQLIINAPPSLSSIAHSRAFPFALPTTPTIFPTLLFNNTPKHPNLPSTKRPWPKQSQRHSLSQPPNFHLWQSNRRCSPRARRSTLQGRWYRRRACGVSSGKQLWLCRYVLNPISDSQIWSIRHKLILH